MGRTPGRRGSDARLEEERDDGPDRMSFRWSGKGRRQKKDDARMGCVVDPKMVG